MLDTVVDHHSCARDAVIEVFFVLVRVLANAGSGFEAYDAYAFNSTLLNYEMYAVRPCFR